MALNGISTATSKADRQLAKLEIAKAKREGRTITESSGTWTASSADTSKPFYRDRNTYDTTELPTVYSTSSNNTNLVVDNPNVGGLVYGRPWI